MAGKAVRQNFADLDSIQKKKLGKAIQALKNNGVWDSFVEKHVVATASRYVLGAGHVNGAHRGPAFLPWHRQFLILMEEELRQASGDETMAIPYWDWGKDPTGKYVFMADLMGGNGDKNKGWVITNGSFAGWTTYTYEFFRGTSPTRIANGPIKRSFGYDGKKMPTPETIRNVMNGSTQYDAPPWNQHAETTWHDVFSVNSFRARMENKLHDPVHDWVGGHMADNMLSPNDPVFYLHHANVDRLWYRWQRQNPSLDYAYGMPNTLPEGQKVNDEMIGLGSVTPGDVWDTSKLPYFYSRANGRRYLDSVYTAAEFGPETVDGAKVLTADIPSNEKAELVNIGFLKTYASYEPPSVDHHLKYDIFRLLQPPAHGVPTNLYLQIDFDDKSGKRPHMIAGNASVMYVSKEISDG